MLLNFLESFYVNYFTITMLGAALITLISGIAFYLLPEKSQTTKFLSYTLLSCALFSIGYVYVQGFYFPSPWGRIIIFSGIILHQALAGQFLCKFPTENAPRFTKYLFIFQLLIIILITIVLIYIAFISGMEYDFNGHYYELQAPVILKIYGLVTVLFSLIAFGLAIWKTIIARKEDRLSLLFIAVAIFSVYIIGAGLNILNKFGFIDRTAFIGTFGLLITLTFFIIPIVYINKTKDRTTFMFKVVGVAFISFILIYNVISLFVFIELEKNFDAIYVKDSEKVGITGKPSKEVAYIFEYDFLNADYKNLVSKSEIDDSPDARHSLYNSWIYTLLSNEESKPENILPFLEMEPGRYSGIYRKIIEETKDTKKALQTLQSIEKSLFRKSSKIKELSDINFRAGFLKFLDKEKPDPYIKNALLEYLSLSASEDVELKSEVLRILYPITPPSSRKYRENKLTKAHYVVYHFIHPDTGKGYEIGYYYSGYKEFMHRTGVRLVILLFIGVLLIIVGMPIFLSGTLITPLNNLLDGLKKVRKGDLSINIPIRVTDEIGFLSGSFNTMVSSIKDAKFRLEDYANHLQEKVEERTKELQVSLEQVEKLKIQQDGDYFLTTLLAQPLGVNTVKSNKVIVDFFVKQKKEFQFKTNSYDLGGDLCTSQEIYLKSQKYIAFLNADAMGKSMQGAGGILVLGAVFQSIIQRTAAYRGYSELSPEYWMKSSFKEMHKVFESFDGSMLISLVFGIVEESSGMVFYINAEHPWVVLYRDNNAEFIEENMKFRKLGTSGITSDLYVSLFQMKPGDYLIIGSDGKDDIVQKGTESENSRVVNEDEKLFLKRVVESKADLKTIYKNISTSYDLIDDFSLLSIHLASEGLENENEGDETLNKLQEAEEAFVNKRYSDSNRLFGEVLNKNPNSIEAAEGLIKCYSQVKMFKEAAGLSKRFLQHRNVETGFMYLASYCLKRNYEFNEAIDLAERIKIREPFNIKNLLHLADMYTFTEKYERAEKILHKVFAIEPENETAKKVESILLKKRQEKE